MEYHGPDEQTGDENEKGLLAVKYKFFLKQCHSQREYRKEVDDLVEKWSGETELDGEPTKHGKDLGGVSTK